MEESPLVDNAPPHENSSSESGKSSQNDNEMEFNDMIEASSPLNNFNRKYQSKVKRCTNHKNSNKENLDINLALEGTAKKLPNCHIDYNFGLSDATPFSSKQCTMLSS